MPSIFLYLFFLNIPKSDKLLYSEFLLDFSFPALDVFRDAVRNDIANVNANLSFQSNTEEQYQIQSTSTINFNDSNEADGETWKYICLYESAFNLIKLLLVCVYLLATTESAARRVSESGNK